MTTIKETGIRFSDGGALRFQIIEDDTHILVSPICNNITKECANAAFSWFTDLMRSLDTGAKKLTVMEGLPRFKSLLYPPAAPFSEPIAQPQSPLPRMASPRRDTNPDHYKTEPKQPDAKWLRRRLKKKPAMPDCLKPKPPEQQKPTFDEMVDRLYRERFRRELENDRTPCLPAILGTGWCSPALQEIERYNGSPDYFDVFHD